MRWVVLVVLAAGMVWTSGPAQAQDNLLSQRPHGAWGTNGSVFAVVRAGNRLFIGGSFTELVNPHTSETIKRRGLAAINTITGKPVTTWHAGVNGTVRALSVSPDGHVLYVGGEFDHLRSHPRTRLGAVGTGAGHLRARWAPAASATVLALLAGPHRVYVGGAFEQINARTREFIAAADPVSGRVLRWNPGANDTVRALAFANNGTRVVVGGSFFLLGGQLHHQIGEVHTGNDSPVGNWNPNPGRPVFDIDVVGGMVLAAAGGKGGALFAYDAADGGKRWAAFSDGDFAAVCVLGNNVVAGGHFGKTRHHARNHIASYRLGNGALQSWAPRLNSILGVRATLCEGNTNVRVGGDFTTVNDKPHPHLVRFHNVT
jgi:hypothetical protein